MMSDAMPELFLLRYLSRRQRPACLPLSNALEISEIFRSLCLGLRNIPFVSHKTFGVIWPLYG